MTEFLRTMSQFGMEGVVEDNAPEMTLEEEMNAEIAMEAELDEAYFGMECANMVAAASQAEAVTTAMAEREVGLESNAGRNAEDIYKEFGLEGMGMEAIKDVAARKMYSGIASLKALINTCISWLKNLIGISVASKKVFAGLAKKAKAMKKQLGKAQSKVSEKLKRDMPDYVKALNTLANTNGTNYAKFAAFSTSLTNHLDGLKTASETDLNSFTKTCKDRIEELNSDAAEKLKEVYDKTDTDEYEGSACYSHIIKFVDNLEKTANKYKTIDMNKGYDKQIKAYEKLRNELNKKDVKITSPDALSKYISANITLLTKQSEFGKKALKEVVRLADDGLTMAKGIYATLA